MKMIILIMAVMSLYAPRFAFADLIESSDEAMDSVDLPLDEAEDSGVGAEDKTSRTLPWTRSLRSEASDRTEFWARSSARSRLDSDIRYLKGTCEREKMKFYQPMPWISCRKSFQRFYCTASTTVSCS